MVIAILQYGGDQQMSYNEPTSNMNFTITVVFIVLETTF